MKNADKHLGRTLEREQDKIRKQANEAPELKAIPLQGRTHSWGPDFATQVTACGSFSSAHGFSLFAAVFRLYYKFSVQRTMVGKVLDLNQDFWVNRTSCRSMNTIQSQLEVTIKMQFLYCIHQLTDLLSKSLFTNQQEKNINSLCDLMLSQIQQFKCSIQKIICFALP